MVWRGPLPGASPYLLQWSTPSCVGTAALVPLADGEPLILLTWGAPLSLGARLCLAPTWATGAWNRLLAVPGEGGGGLCF